MKLDSVSLAPGSYLLKFLGLSVCGVVSSLSLCYAGACVGMLVCGAVSGWVCARDCG